MDTIKIAGALTLLVAALGQQVGAQTFDTSGNNLLQGTYYFREVIWVVGDNSGTLGRAIATYGNISFDGNGNYNISNTQVMDSNNGTPQNFSTSGTYSIAASGFGFLSHPISSGDFVYGLVSHGIFVGSSTEGGFNSVFIAAPLASPAPTNSSFSGSYTMMSLDFPDGVPNDTVECQFQLNPNGAGNIGNVAVTGFVGGGGTQGFKQNASGVKYFFSNGAANVNFGSSEANVPNSALIAGTKYLYFSPDGNFVFGGSPTAFDMIVGVKNGGAPANFNGLYYNAGGYQDESNLGNGSANLNTFYGSLSAGGSVLIGHQRLLSLFNSSPLDFTYSDTFNLNNNGFDDGFFTFLFGSGGAVRIGMGDPPILGIDVAVQAPTFTSSGVFINPTGVVNAASSAPFTAGIAPGELISIYGSGLAPSLKIDATFPTSLNGVQVLINNAPAPIYFVSSGQISVVVPFATTQTIADIQVINNGKASNTVSTYTSMTAPGVFTSPAGGIGSAAALHADFSLVTPARPAQPGETILLFVTGLGAVTPAVADGAPGPTNPLSQASNTISVFMGGQTATVSFAGLAPGLIGLDQINVQVPTGLSAGNIALEVAGPDSDTLEAFLPIGGGTANSTPAPASHLRVPRTSGGKAAPKLCGLGGCSSSPRRSPFGKVPQ